MEKVRLEELQKRWANSWPTMTLEHVPYSLENTISHMGFHAVFLNVCDCLGGLEWDAFSVSDPIWY